MLRLNVYPWIFEYHLYNSFSIVVVVSIIKHKGNVSTNIFSRLFHEEKVDKNYVDNWLFFGIGNLSRLTLSYINSMACIQPFKSSDEDYLVESYLFSIFYHRLPRLLYDS